VFAPARNPWNPLHMPGSSSSGSGTAVAAGFCLGATGTDTGGSVRHPAAACGLVGFKPTRGVLPMDGVIPLAPSMDHVGLLTRSVGDAVLMFAAMRGDATHAPTVRTPHTAGASGAASPQASASSGSFPPPRTALPGLRIGVMRRQLLAQTHDAEIWQCFEEVLARCRASGDNIQRFQRSTHSELHLRGLWCSGMWQRYECRVSDVSGSGACLGHNFAIRVVYHDGCKAI
jgi:aspartyl-tRNA(Asn)/glutamyl-tRNA(Gln) amidotransferase subunit A